MRRKRKLRKIEKEYRVVDKLEKGDYIFIHYNGYVFKANNYPYNLRDGIANRDLMTGETIKVIIGGNTEDVSRTPLMPKESVLMRALKDRQSAMTIKIINQLNEKQYNRLYGQ